ncbi:Putative vacuolar protein sorting-associated protein 13A [Galdieria sulphuraria]|nr:Putative vacuolar protein sorting-associated protein 13A [Galdieria sulphuraria]
MHLKAVYIGKLLLKFQLKSWFFHNIEIAIQEVSCCLETFSISELSELEFETYSRSLRAFYLKRKKKRLKLLDKQLRDYFFNPQQVPDDSLRQLLVKSAAKIFAQFKVTVENLHIRLEDCHTALSGPLCCGVFVEKLLVERAFFKSRPFVWDINSLEVALDIHKYIHLKNLNVYLNSYEFPISHISSASQFLEQMKRSGKESQCLISSFCANGSLNLLFPPVDFSESLKISLDVQASELNVTASAEQIRCISYIATYMAFHVQLTQRRLKSHLPTCRPKKDLNISEWWQYALRCVVDQINLPTRICPLCVKALECVDGGTFYTSSIGSSLLHNSHSEIQDMMQFGNRRILIAVVYSLIVQSRFIRKKTSNNIVLENVLLEEELIFGRTAAYYLTYQKGEFPNMNGISSMNGDSAADVDKVQKSNQVEDCHMFVDFVWNFYQSIQNKPTFFETAIKLTLSNLITAAYDYNEDDKRLCYPLLSLKGNDLGIVFSTAQQLPNDCLSMYESNSKHPMLGYLWINMDSLTLNLYDEYSPTFQKLSTIHFLSGRGNPSLNLLLCLHRNFRLVWETKMFLHTEKWLQCLATRDGPFLSIDICGIEAELSSLDALTRVIRFSLHCIPRKPIHLETLTPFRVFGQKEYWTQICRKVQQPRLKLRINLGSAEIDLLCKDIQSKTYVELHMDKLSFHNALPTTTISPCCEEDWPRIYLYQDWIIEFQRVAADFSLEFTSTEKLRILHLHSDHPSQLLFSTCSIASDLHLPSLNINANSSLYLAVDLSEFEGISKLIKTIQEILEKVRHSLNSSKRLIYTLMGKIQQGSVPMKGLIELYQDGLLCLCTNGLDNDAIVCERLRNVEVGTNCRIDKDTLKLRKKMGNEECLFKPDSVHSLESFIRLLSMQVSDEKHPFSEPFLASQKRKLDFCIALDLTLQLELPDSHVESQEEEYPRSLICQLTKLELLGMFSSAKFNLEAYLQSIKIWYGNQNSSQREIRVELSAPPKLQNVEPTISKPSSLYLQATKETTSNLSTNFFINVALCSLKGVIWSSQITEILELLKQMNSLLNPDRNDKNAQQTLKKKSQVQFGLNLRIFSSQVEFIYPNLSKRSSTLAVFRKLALSFDELHFSLNTSFKSEKLRLFADLGPQTLVIHSLMENNAVTLVAEREKILSFHPKDDKLFPLHFDMSLNADTETQNTLLLTFRLSQLHSLYNHFAIMDLVVVILRFVALGNMRNSNKKKDNVTSILLSLHFTIDNPTIGIPCLDDTDSLSNYLQCNSRNVQLGIMVKNEGAGSPENNGNHQVSIIIKGEDWKVDQGFVFRREARDSVFILVPLLYPSHMNLNILMGSSQPLTLSISSSHLSILLRKASILDILRLVFPIFVTYPYTLLQGNSNSPMKEQPSTNKSISIRHQFDSISIKWFDENSELLLPNSVFAMDMPLDILEELENWSLWNDFVDTEWIRNELLSNNFILEIFLGGKVDDKVPGTKLHMNIASKNIHIGESYSSLYEWHYFSRISSLVTIGSFAFSLSLDPSSFGIQVTSKDNQSLQLFLGMTGTRQLVANIVYIVKEIPSYLNSIRGVGNEVYSATADTRNDKQFTWDIDLPIELHFIAGISKARNVEINDGFHELILRVNPNLKGTIQTQPYLEIHELSCLLHQFVCIHRSWSIFQDKSYNIIVPIEISVKVMVGPDETASSSVISNNINTDSASKSIVFSMTRVEGYLLMEDVVLILSCIKECKDSFQLSNTSHTVRKTEMNRVLSVPCYKEQLSYNLDIQMEDIRLSLISYERGSSFSIVETVVSNFHGSGMFWSLTSEYSLHLSLLLRLYQFAVVHGTWNNLLEPCQVEFVAMRKLECADRKQQVHILLGDAIQITLTETWLHSLISYITRWKDVSVLFFSKVSLIELQRFESLINNNSKESTDSHLQSADSSLEFKPSHSIRSVLIRNGTGLDIMLTGCRWEKEDILFCDDMRLARNSEQVIYIHSRFLDRIHRWADRDESFTDKLEQSVKLTVTFLPIPLRAKGKIRLFQEDVYFLPVFEMDDLNEMGTLCLQVSLLETQWEIVIRSVFKFVNNTNFGLLFLLEDSVGNIYDPSLSSSTCSDVNKIMLQLYQVPIVEKDSQSEIFASHEKSLSGSVIQKASFLNSDSNFIIPFVFCSWTCYVRFAVESWNDDNDALASHWSVSVQLKEEFILKEKHVLVSFPIRWTKLFEEDIVAVSYKRQENSVQRQSSVCLAERIEENSHSSSKRDGFYKRPMDVTGAVLLQCLSCGEMKIMAPLLVRNELAVAISYRMYVGRQHNGYVYWISWKELQGRLQPGETTQKYCLYSSCLLAIEWFQLGDLSGIFVEPNQVHHFDNLSSWKKLVLFPIDSDCLIDSWNTMETKRCLKEHHATFYHSDGRLLQMHFGLFLGENDSSLLARLSSPYWVSNCTGLPLLFRDIFGIASGISSTIENVHSGVEDTFPVMMSLNHLDKAGMLRIGRKGLHYISIWIPECPKSRAIPVSILGYHSVTLKVAYSSIYRIPKLSIYSSLRRGLFEAAAFLRLSVYTQFHPSYEDSKALSILPETLFCFQLEEQDLVNDPLIQKFASFGVEMDHVALHGVYLGHNGRKTDRRIESETHATRKLFQWVSLKDKVPLLFQNMPTRKRTKLCIRIGFRMSRKYEEEGYETQSISVSSAQDEVERNGGNYVFLWSDWFAVNAPSEFTVAVNIPKEMEQLKRIESLQVSDSIWKRPHTVFDYPYPEDFMLDRIFWMIRTSRDPSTRTQFIILKKAYSQTKTEIKNWTLFLIAYGQEKYLHDIRLVPSQTSERLIWSDPLATRVISLFVQHRQGISKFRLNIKDMGTQVLTEQLMSNDASDSSFYQLNATVELLGRVLTIRLESIRKETYDWTHSLYSSVAQRWNFLVPWKRSKYLKVATPKSTAVVESTETSQVCSFHFQVTIPFIGISFIDDEELWEECFYISLSNLLFSLKQQSSIRKVEMTVSHFQCDQSITLSDSPVLLASLQHPFLFIFLEMQSFETVNHYHQIDVLVSEFALKMDNELLFRLLEFIKQRAKYFSQALDSFHILEDVWLSRGDSLPSVEQVFTKLISPHLNRTDTPSYFEHVILHPVACRFSFTMKGSFERGWLPFMESWMRNTGLLLGEIEDNLLWVDQLELNNAVETLDGLSRNILWHVIKSLWSNMFTALGGLSALGDMTSTVLHLRQGTLQFFVEPIRGSLTGEPHSLWRGVHRGTIMLGRSCIYSIAQPVSRLSWALAKGIAYGSMNRAFISTLSAHEEEWKHATDIWNGTLMGLQRWRTCLSYMCNVPFGESVSRDSDDSFATDTSSSSSMAAVTSIVSLPLSGFFFFISNVAEGTRNMTGLQATESERIRLPRYVMKGYPIKKYDPYAAKGQYLLRQTDPQRRERYIMHIQHEDWEQDIPYQTYFILSTSHITALKQQTKDSSRHSPITLLWRIPQTAIQKVNMTHEGTDSLLEISFRLQSTGWQTALHWLDPSRIVASSTAVVTSLWRHEKSQSPSSDTIVIRETATQTQLAKEKHLPTLTEWQEKLSNLLTIH